MHRWRDVLFSCEIPSRAAQHLLLFVAAFFCGIWCFTIGRERELERERERNQLGQRCQTEFRVLQEHPVRSSHSPRSCTEMPQCVFLPVLWKSIRQQLLTAVIFTASYHMKANRALTFYTCHPTPHSCVCVALRPLTWSFLMYHSLGFILRVLEIISTCNNSIALTKLIAQIWSPRAKFNSFY